jgi:hypothetical protein
MDLRREEVEGASERGRRRGLGFAGVVGATLTMVVGLWFIGSPARERYRQLDARRVGDLRAISSAIDRYWTEHGELPSSLDELASDPRTSVTAIVDPVTQTPYEYSRVDSVRFELCAVFAKPDSLVHEPPGEPPRFWRHGAGRTCYALRATRTTFPR